MKPVAPKLLRCAIYTRVSTDHGLEQEFNSLDNQREAAQAYVKSQAHEGWRPVRERYDDGGFSARRGLFRKHRTVAEGLVPTVGIGRRRTSSGRSARYAR